MDQATQQNLLELVKNNYDQIAVSFSTTRTKYIWPELVKLAGQVKDGDKILDVGCGNGRLLQVLGGKNIQYLGLDNSVKLLEEARNSWKMSAALRSGDWNFIQGDILSLERVPNKDFDYIFCVAVLHHLPGIDLRIKALKQMKAKIGLGGKIVVTVWNLWTQEKFNQLIRRAAFLKFFGKSKMDYGDIVFDWKDHQGQPVSRRYYHAFTKRGLKKIAAQAGLKVDKLYSDKFNYYLILEK
ncbi:MAG: class I SAM-dependent methyltransferase [Patescibacteria group bacterium]|nr:class I SAM-dependent methyltransferase [Patescibacteria group bacterium]